MLTTQLDEQLVDFVDEIVIEVSWNLHFCLCPNPPNAPCISYNPPTYFATVPHPNEPQSPNPTPNSTPLLVDSINIRQRPNEAPNF